MPPTTQFDRFKRATFFLLRVSGLPYLLRELMQRRRVTILVYHKLAPEVADVHFEILRRKYNIVSLADYLDYRTDPAKQLPRKPLVVTLDDGHKGNYALKPVLQKHQIRATIFLCSGLVGTSRHFWFETDMSNDVRQKLKRVSDDERVDALRTFGFSEQEEYSTRQALSASEIEDMKTIVDFQSHTILHPILPRCSAIRASNEISESKAQLESMFGLSINALAYPNGDYSDRDMQSAEKSGYRCALTLNLGFKSRSTPAFQLKRICINDDASVDELIVRASGLWESLKRAVRVVYTGRSSGQGNRLEYDRPRYEGVADEN